MIKYDNHDSKIGRHFGIYRTLASAKTTFGFGGFCGFCGFHVDSTLRKRSTLGFCGFCTTQSIRWGILWILSGAINGTPDSQLPTLHAVTYAYVLGTFQELCTPTNIPSLPIRSRGGC